MHCRIPSVTRGSDERQHVLLVQINHHRCVAGHVVITAGLVTATRLKIQFRNLNVSATVVHFGAVEPPKFIRQWSIVGVICTE